MKKPNVGHKTSRIEDELKNLIEKGEFIVGAPIWTEKELCEYFGASRVTIRRSIENLVGQGVLYRLKGKGTFVSPSLKRKRRKSFVLMLPVNFESYFGGIARGAVEAAADAGYQAVLKLTHDFSRKSEKKILSNIPWDEIDGMIVAPIHSYEDDDFYLKLNEKVRNVVYVNCLPPLLKSSEIDIVLGDDMEGAKIAAEHLISLGHRRIAHFAGALNTSNSVERVEGYKKALKEADIEFDEKLLSICNFNTEMAKAEALRLLSLSKDRPTAVFCASDSMAIGVFEAVFKLGLKIPEDLSVVGFGDNHTLFPGLTTINMNSSRIGREAFELLKDKVERGKQCGKKIILPPKLIKRDSCANVVS